MGTLAFPQLGSKGGVYFIRCTQNGRHYVGSSVNMSRRVSDHKRSLERGVHHNRYLQNAYNKYDWEAFEVRKLEDVADVEKLFEREQFWMDVLRAADRRFGFNDNPKAEGLRGRVLTENERANRRRILDAVRHLTQTPESIARRAAILRGRPHTAQSRANMSAGKKGRPGRKLSAEERASLAKINRERAAAGLHPRVDDWIVEDPCGQRIEVRNLSVFCKKEGLHPSALYAVADGRSASHKGWRAWRKSDPEPTFVPRPPPGDEGDEYVFVSPEGVRHEGRNMLAFCREHGLCYSTMVRLNKGEQYASAEGWTSPAWGDHPPPVGGRHGKAYRLRHRDGRDIIVQNLSQFCEEQGFSNNFSKVMRGVLTHWRGWTCERL